MITFKTVEEYAAYLRSIQKKYPKKKYRLYLPERTWKPEYVRGVKHEGSGPTTICGEHVILANIIKEGVEDPELRHRLLEQVDIVYDMGKRMGNKLVDYHNKSKKGGGWREGY